MKISELKIILGKIAEKHGDVELTNIQDDTAPQDSKENPALRLRIYTDGISIKTELAFRFKK